MAGKRRRAGVLPPHLRGKRARARVLREQRNALARDDLSGWQRATAVLAYMDGTSSTAIARVLGVDRSTVVRWMAAYVVSGASAMRRGAPPGPSSRLTDAQLEQLGQLIDAGPQASGFSSGVWIGRMICELIKERFGIRYHPKYMPELLHRLGFSVQRPRKLLSRADHAAQARWLRKTWPALKKKPTALAG